MFATFLSKACNGINCVYSTDGQLHVQLQPTISLTGDIAAVCGNLLLYSDPVICWPRLKTEEVTVLELSWYMVQWPEWNGGRWGGSCNLLSSFSNNLLLSKRKYLFWLMKGPKFQKEVVGEEASFCHRALSSMKRPPWSMEDPDSSTLSAPHLKGWCSRVS